MSDIPMASSPGVNGSRFDYPYTNKLEELDNAFLKTSTSNSQRKSSYDAPPLQSYSPPSESQGQWHHHTHRHSVDLGLNHESSLLEEGRSRDVGILAAGTVGVGDSVTVIDHGDSHKFRGGYAWMKQFNEFNHPGNVVLYLAEYGAHKCTYSIWYRVWAGGMAGFYTTLGGLWALSVEGGLDPTWRAANPGITRLLGGLVFPLALTLTFITNTDLCTGNMMIGSMAWVLGKITVRDFAYLLVVSFFANMWGILAADYFIGYLTDIFALEPFHSMIISIATGKVYLPWGVTLLKGVGANALVTLSLVLGATSRSVVGRLICMWPPIAAFITIGYEHVIANMVYIPVGMLYGAPFSVSRYIIHSIFPTFLGNWIGGGLLVALPLVYLHAWDKRRFKTIPDFLRYNFQPSKPVAQIINSLFTQEVFLAYPDKHDTNM